MINPTQQADNVLQLPVTFTQSLCGTLKSRAHAMSAVNDLLRKRASGIVTHVPCGFRDLDELLQDFLDENRFIVLGGRPAMGKTALVQQIKENVAGLGRPVIFYSLEMTDRQLCMRDISRLTGISHEQLLKPQDLDEEDLSQIQSAQTYLERLPIFTDDETRTIEDICQKSMQASAEIEQRGMPKLGLIVVDYLQIVGGGKGDNRTGEVGYVSNRLKALSNQLKVPVLAIASLNRNVESRPNKRPMMSDLRECGSVEFDADTILMLYRDEVYNEDTKDKGMAEVICVKHRYGNTGTVDLKWDGENVQFSNVDRYPTTTPEAYSRASGSSMAKRGGASHAAFNK
jgi:replicative DNA helicase